MQKHVKDLRFINNNKYTFEEIYLLINRIYLKTFNIIFLTIFKKKKNKFFIIKSTINKHPFKKLIFLNNKEKKYSLKLILKKRLKKKKKTSFIFYYFKNYFLINYCWYIFKFFYIDNKVFLNNKKINNFFFFKFSDTLLIFLRHKRVFFNFLENFSLNKRILKWTKFLFNYYIKYRNVIWIRRHFLNTLKIRINSKRKKRWIRRRLLLRKRFIKNFKKYKKNVYLDFINAKRKKSILKKKIKNIKRIRKYFLANKYPLFNKKENLIEFNERLKIKKNLIKYNNKYFKLKRRKFNIIWKFYKLKKIPFWRIIRKSYSKFYSKVVLLYTLRHIKIHSYNYFLKKPFFKYYKPKLNPLLHYGYPPLIKKLRKDHLKSIKIANILKTARKLKKNLKKKRVISKFFFLPLKYRLNSIQFFNFLWLKVYNNINNNKKKLKLLNNLIKINQILYLNFKIFQYFYYPLNLIYKNHYYSCIIKKKRSNVYVTLINRFGDVKYTYSAGMVWKLRRRKIRKSLRALTLMIRAFSKKLIFKYHVKILYKLYLLQSYKRFYKRVYKEFLKNGIEIKNFIYIKKRPHSLLNRTRKIRRL